MMPLLGMCPPPPCPDDVAPAAVSEAFSQAGAPEPEPESQAQDPEPEPEPGPAAGAQRSSCLFGCGAALLGLALLL